MGEGLFPFLLHPSMLPNFFFFFFFLATKATGESSRNRPLVTGEPRRLRGFAAEPPCGQVPRLPVSLPGPSASPQCPLGAAAGTCNQFLLDLVTGRKREALSNRGLCATRHFLSGYEMQCIFLLLLNYPSNST